MEFYIDLEEDSEESFVVYRDERHGKQGFRVLRYIYIDKNDKKRGADWDEYYMFFENLNDFWRAVETQNYIQGRADF